jgi:hypothetical protein
MATLDVTPQGLQWVDAVDGLSLPDLERLVGLPIAA